MAFRLNRRESLSAGIRRVLHEEISLASGHLAKAVDAGQGSSTRNRVIHETRRSIKKLRALLRMLEPRVGSIARQETLALGNASRLLGAARDTAATQEVIDHLRQHPGGKAVARSLTALAGRLNKSPADSASELHEASTALRQIQGRMEEWPPLPDSFGPVGVGLRETYRRGRSALRKLEAEHDPEAFHTLRKRVKDQWYQVRLMDGIWNSEPREKQLRELQDCLGNEHNLTVLEERTALVPSVRKLVDQVRAELRTRSLDLARQLYSEKPRVFAANVRARWDTWRSEHDVPRKEAGVEPSRRKKQSAA